ncbi:class I SAM-dependent methyltransferase [candidate division KSB1 bacterium]|nr:class I SAM-dependent methyltransferase [candidate division KSB1 bacterium]
MLDIGAGDGRLLQLLLLKCPNADGIALDFSPIMFGKLRERYSNNNRVEIIEHNLNNPLPSVLGEFDVIVSSFAIPLP